FYGVFDLFAARGALYTVNVLGQAVFRGLRDPAVLQVPLALDPLAIFLYNGLHLALSLAIGVFVTSLIFRVESRPAQAPLVLFTVVAGFVITVFVVGYLSAPIRPLLPWWSIVAANLLAMVAGGGYLLVRHPALPSAFSMRAPLMR
ncbi:MAG: hypothetical protein AB1762_04185, partial [Gemmatimonadota bacterium]